jgi:hypothetical protein
VTLELFGVTIHEADVALTDVGLALLGGWIAFSLGGMHPRTDVQTYGARINAALAVAAFGGALFHAFFPAKVATASGRAMWLFTTTAIAVATSYMLLLALRLVAPKWSYRKVAAVIVGIAFVGTIAFVDPSYRTVVLFYGPALLLLLAAATREAVRSTESAWWLVAGGLGLSVLAALLQQARVRLHPIYADHNALYHVVQAVALFVLYRGFARVTDPVVATRT